jgi:hypothetical protein
MQIAKVNRGPLTWEIPLPSILQALVGRPKPKGLKREMLSAQTLEIESLGGMMAQVQDQIVTLVSNNSSDRSIRFLGSIACILQEATHSHHRIAIKLGMARMVAKGNPNKLTG